MNDDCGPTDVGSVWSSGDAANDDARHEGVEMNDECGPTVVGTWNRRLAAGRLAALDHEPRLDVVARGQLEQLRGRYGGERRAAKGTCGNASRISSGRFCQTSRMKAAGDRPPSSARGSRRFMCAIVPALVKPAGHGARAPLKMRRDEHFRPLRRHAHLAAVGRPERAHRRTRRADRILLRRRRPAAQGRGGARRPGAGFDVHLHLEPENAFGDYHSELVCFEDRALFPDGVEVGMQFEGLPDGAVTPDMPEDTVYTVTEVYPSHVVLDGNHPLAGLAIRMHSPCGACARRRRTRSMRRACRTTRQACCRCCRRRTVAAALIGPLRRRRRGRAAAPVPLERARRVQGSGGSGCAVPSRPAPRRQGAPASRGPSMLAGRAEAAAAPMLASKSRRGGTWPAPPARSPAGRCARTARS